LISENFQIAVKSAVKSPCGKSVVKVLVKVLAECAIPRELLPIPRAPSMEPSRASSPVQAEGEAGAGVGGGAARLRAPSAKAEVGASAAVSQLPRAQSKRVDSDEIEGRVIVSWPLSGD
jgi:hypothetical protein